MSLETELLPVLRAVCPRVFPDVAPLDTPEPYVVYHRIGGEITQYVDGALAQRQNSLVQVNVWSAGRSQSNQIAAGIENALVAHQTLQAQPQTALTALYDEDAELRGCMQDFSLWADR